MSYSTKAGSNLTRGSVQDDLIVPMDISIKSIANMQNLVTAYEFIKSKPGNMTPGTDNSTLDGISLKYLENIQKDLKSGKFKFSPGRKVEIPKPGKKETRPLIIASPREKVVQKAIQIVMNHHFDPIFSRNSYGFRPNLSLTAAIHRLDGDFQSSK